jgi:hypothetical protein
MSEKNRSPIAQKTIKKAFQQRWEDEKNINMTLPKTSRHVAKIIISKTEDSYRKSR